MSQPLNYHSARTDQPLEPRCPYCGGEAEPGFVVSGAVLRWTKADAGRLSRAFTDITDIRNKGKIAGITGANAIRCHSCQRIVIAI